MKKADTTPEIESIFRAMVMKRSGANRLVMGCEMFDTAKEIALASLAHLAGREAKLALFKRFYGNDVDDVTTDRILSEIEKQSEA